MKTFLTHALGLAMAAVLVLLAIALAACSDDAELVIPDPAKSSLPFPVTPEMLMGNVREAYGSQDLAGYAAMLHPDFEFERTDGAVYGRDTELRIAARMFSGEDYVKPDRTIAGIAKIEIDRFEGLGEWVPVPEEEREVLGRTYLVKLRFVQTDGNVLSVRGSTHFQVIRDEMVDSRGEGRPGWRVLRQVDGT